jgi:serine/threonine protein kinase
MCFKEYPYYDKNKNMLLINSGKKINQIKDIELNDLMDKLLKINIEERINWDDYFNHSFFKQLSNFECNKHFKQFNYYCKSCKLNICDDCLEGHNNDEIISFSFFTII